MIRIVCVGNPLAAEDAAGPAVYRMLRERVLPAGVELHDGGLRGLDLLPLFQGAERVVLVDAIAGMAEDGAVRVLEGDEVASLCAGPYDHAAGIPYLLAALPHVLPPPLPHVVLVGVEGAATPDAVDRAARRALALCEGR